jgi:dipeptidyl aminopeptidase/acylaminoacyl peptidase
MQLSYHINFRPFWRIGLALCLLVSVLFGGTALAARNAPSVFACLRIGGDMPARDWLLDFNNGVLTADARPLTDPFSYAPHNAWTSPDGRHYAYTLPDRSLTRRFTLYVQPNSGTVAPHMARPMVNDAVINAVSWSPDGAHLLYLYRDANNAPHFGLARANGDGATVVRLNTPRANEIAFFGWSADGAYFAVGTTEVFGRVLTYYETSTLRAKTFPLISILPYVESAVWSERGQRHAYLRTDQVGRTRLVVSLLDSPVYGGEELSLEMPFLRNARLFWSPDGNYLALRYNDQNLNWQLIIYAIAPRSFQPRQVAQFTQGGRLLFPASAAWSADSSALAYFRERRGGRDLVAFRPATGESEVLVERVMLAQQNDFLWAIENSARPTRRAAVPFLNGRGEIDVDLMNFDGTERVPIVRGATDVENVLWSPDGALALIKWQRRDFLRVDHYITWARTDGSGLQTISAEEFALDQVLWLREGGQFSGKLAYTYMALTRYGVEVLDLNTGVRRTLARNLTKAQALTYDTAAQTLQFWWLDRQRGGVDGYTLDGVRRYRYHSPSGSIETPHLARSPNGRHAAMLVRASGNWALQVASEGDDGAGRVLWTGKQPMPPPLWSADGERFAVFVSVNNSGLFGMFSVEVYNSAGDLLYTYPQVPLRSVSEALWTRCE